MSKALGKLRADLIKRHPAYDVGSVYQGYMDMTYFSLVTEHLKDKGHKFVISNSLNVFHDENNPDAVIECALTSTPDFDDLETLMYVIEQGAEKFVTAITSLL